jgi:hypothetical protein
VNRKRREFAELKSLLQPANAWADGPWTFGLTDDQLAAEANRPHALGWPVEEITSVLDVSPRVAS